MTSYPYIVFQDAIMNLRYPKDAIMTSYPWTRHYDLVSWDAIMTSYPGTPL